jgi:hypothetical protein
MTVDLKAAQFTIDTLLMLRDKTKGNLSKKEEEILSSAISNLQLNFADETVKSKEQTKTEVPQNSTADENLKK